MGKVAIKEKPVTVVELPQPDNCPYCGSVLLSTDEVETMFECFTHVIDGTVYRSSRCYEFQIAKLEKKLKNGSS